MENYNFLADLLSTFRSMPDWIKALWIVVPPLFVLAFTALIIRLRQDNQPMDTLKPDHDLPQLHWDEQSQMRHITRNNHHIDDVGNLISAKPKKDSHS